MSILSHKISARAAAGAICALVIVLGIIYLRGPSGPPAPLVTAKHDGTADIELLAQTKVLRSLDVDSHVARVDGDMWGRWGGEAKMSAARMLAGYCGEKSGKGEWVRVYDRGSGRLLAEYSSRAGYVGY